MLALPRRLACYALTARSIAMTALLGASFLATPLTAAYAADPAPPAQQSGADTAETQAETVEQRITNLHAELKIVSEFFRHAFNERAHSFFERTEGR